MTTPAYRVEISAPMSCRSVVIGLWRGNLGTGVDLERKFDWIYGDDQVAPGKIFLLIATAENRPVGAYGLVPRKFVVDGQVKTGAVLSDLVVEKSHRTLFPAMILQKAVMDSGAKEYDFVYGFPNENAKPIFRRLGYQPLGRMARYIKLFDARRVLNKHLPSVIAACCAPFVNIALRMARIHEVFNNVSVFESDWDSETRASSGNSKLFNSGNRTAEFLKRRFEQNPRDGYLRVVLKNKDKQYVGYAVVRREEDILTVEDVSCEKNMLSSVLRALGEYARKRGAGAIQVEMLSNGNINDAFQRAGYTPREGRELYFFSNNSVFFEKMRDCENWWITSADEDQ